MKVNVWFDKTSQPILHDAITTYQKGDLFCVRLVSGVTVKYPINHIFRIEEWEE